MAQQAIQLDVEQFSKFATESVGVDLDFSLTTVESWSSNAPIKANDLRRPNTASESADGADHSTGYYYQANADGQTGTTEPIWPTTGTVKDGSVTWTPVAPGDSIGDPVTTVSVTPIQWPDQEFEAAVQIVTGRSATIALIGGTRGSTYITEFTGNRQSTNGRTIRLIVQVS